MKPSLWWFGFAALVAMVGIVVAIVLVVVGARSFLDRIDDFDRVAVPGNRQVELGTGGYSVYHEYPGHPTTATSGVPTSTCRR